jgi:hypothetical protein
VTASRGHHQPGAQPPRQPGSPAVGSCGVPRTTFSEGAASRQKEFPSAMPELRRWRAREWVICARDRDRPATTLHARTRRFTGDHRSFFRFDMRRRSPVYHSFRAKSALAAPTESIALRDRRRGSAARPPTALAGGVLHAYALGCLRDPDGRAERRCPAYPARWLMCAARKPSGTSDSAGWPISSPSR